MEEEEEEVEEVEDSASSSGASNRASSSGVSSGSGRSRRKSPVTIAWMGGGKLLSTEDSQKTEGFCRFVLYEGDVSPGVIRKRHKTSNLSILCHITLPRA